MSKNLVMIKRIIITLEEKEKYYNAENANRNKKKKKVYKNF